jgi:hypothetical protein
MTGVQTLPGAHSKLQRKALRFESESRWLCARNRPRAPTDPTLIFKIEQVLPGIRLLPRITVQQRET